MGATCSGRGGVWFWWIHIPYTQIFITTHGIDVVVRRITTRSLVLPHIFYLSFPAFLPVPLRTARAPFRSNTWFAAPAPSAAYLAMRCFAYRFCCCFLAAPPVGAAVLLHQFCVPPTLHTVPLSTYAARLPAVPTHSY